MEGFDENRVKRLLKLPDSSFPIMVVAAGERAGDGVFWPELRFDRSPFVHTVGSLTASPGICAAATGVSPA